MGSGRVRFSDGMFVLDLIADRSQLVVALGSVAGQTTWTVDVWAEALGVEPVEASDFAGQVEFAIDLLPVARVEAERDPELENRVRNLNWRRVKEALGLDPDTPLPPTAPRTG